MKDFIVRPGSRVRLKELPADPPREARDGKERIKEKTLALGRRLGELQELLFAEKKHRLLLVLQGLDTSGKDSTIRRVFAPVGPAGVRVVSFKGPTQPELEHDYLWRIHAAVPGNGELTVFNRSHYEELLVVRVQKIRPPEVWKRRFEHINAFEKMLSDEGTTILKFFLHISREEQKRRLQERLDDHTKHWKLDPTDFRDRSYWQAYWEAYEEVLERTSTARAPWRVIPANAKWWRDHLVSRAVVEALEGLAMRYPKPAKGLRKLKLA